MSRNLIAAAGAALLLILSAGPAPAQQAQTPPPPSQQAPARAVREACADDVKKFCADVQPGGGRMARCMKAHETELSEGCKSALKEHRDKALERRAKRKGAPAEPPVPPANNPQ